MYQLASPTWHRRQTLCGKAKALPVRVLSPFAPQLPATTVEVSGTPAVSAHHSSDTWLRRNILINDVTHTNFKVLPSTWLLLAIILIYLHQHLQFRII
jgi:hypothetical protein